MVPVPVPGFASQYIVAPVLYFQKNWGGGCPITRSLGAWWPIMTPHIGRPREGALLNCDVHSTCRETAHLRCCRNGFSCHFPEAISPGSLKAPVQQG